MGRVFELVPFRSALAVLLVWLLLCSAAAAEPPRPEPVPGGVAVVPLAKGDRAPRAHYQGKPVLVARYGAEWQALVGIPLGAKPGRHTLEVDGNEIGFEIGDKAYAEQRLTVSKRHVNPEPADLRRIEKDVAVSRAAYRTFTHRPPEFGFILPVEGRLTSPFGLRRFFNDEERSPHSGIDIAAPTGTPVRSPAPGVVLAVGDLFFNGKSVFIEHGQGLVTMVCHLDSIDVKEGDPVERGSRIGTVGATGRATGPHLHWSVSLNDARVDPLLFLGAGVANALTESAR